MQKFFEIQLVLAGPFEIYEKVAQFSEQAVYSINSNTPQCILSLNKIRTVQAFFRGRLVKIRDRRALTSRVLSICALQ